MLIKLTFQVHKNCLYTVDVINCIDHHEYFDLLEALVEDRHLGWDENCDVICLKERKLFITTTSSMRDRTIRLEAVIAYTAVLCDTTGNI